MNKIKKNNKKQVEKSLSLIEIFILLAGFIAISYFIGDEFRLVGAFGGDSAPATGINPVQVLNRPAVPCVDYMAAECLTPKAIPDPIPTPTTPVDPVVEFDIFPGSPGDLPPVFSHLNFALSSILVAAAVGTVLGLATRWILQWLGVDEELAIDLGLTVAISYAVTVALQSTVFATSIGTWGSLATLGGSTTFLGGFFANTIWLSGPAAIAVLVAVALYFLLFYQETKYVIVQYTCTNWEPPLGSSASCNKCNNGPLPCTKYKCESLGSKCELVNPDDEADKYCTYNDRLDAVPAAISSNDKVLLDDFDYVPNTKVTLDGRGDMTVGVTINYTGEDSDGTGCIPTYKLFTYGISLDKLATCKVDTVMKNNYSEMRFPLSNGKTLFNHTIYSYYENASVEVGSGWIVQRSGENYELHVRCNSTSNIQNVATFAFKYCIQKESVKTPTKFVEVNPLNNSAVKQGQDTKNISLFVSKPSECRWSRNSEDNFDTMINNFSCAQTQTARGVNIVYPCQTTLNGIVDETQNMFYFSCKTYPGKDESQRRVNEQPYAYSLVGTKGLIIEDISPDEEELIKGSTINVNTTIVVKTAGGFDNGKAVCALRNTANAADTLSTFDVTNSYEHLKKLWLTQGDYNYYVECCDVGLNCDNRTIDFEVESDISAPKIIRIGSELASGKQLKIITNEEAECAYGITSCSYELDEGIKFTTEDSLTHFTEWDTDNTLYVKCKDKFPNRPDYDECTAIIRPFSLS